MANAYRPTRAMDAALMQKDPEQNGGGGRPSARALPRLLIARRPEPRMIDECTTKGRLIAACESMMGQRGFGGVAMHEIAAQAGQSNKYAVQYHFGGREGLIEAVFATRYQIITDRRSHLLQQASSAGIKDSVEGLLEIIYLPIAEQIDSEGNHSFARFWLQYFTKAEAPGISTNPFRGSRGLFSNLLSRLDTELGAAKGYTEDSLHLLGFLNFAALIDRDNRRHRGQRAPSVGYVVAKTAATMAAALRGELR